MMKHNNLVANHILLAATLLFMLTLAVTYVGQQWGLNYASLGLLSGILQTQLSSHQHQVVEHFRDIPGSVETPSRNPNAQHGLVHALLQAGEIETAQAELLNIPPGDLRRIGLIHLGTALARRGELLQAIQVWSEADALLLLMEQGNALAAQGDTEQATAVWYAAFRTLRATAERGDPLPSSQIYEPILLNLVYQGLLPQQDYTSAIEVLSFLLSLEPLSSSLHRRIGAVYSSSGEYVQAIQALDRAIELNPTDFRNFTDRARAARQIGNWKEAIAFMEAGYAVAPEVNKPDIAFNLSEAYDRLRDSNATLTWLTKSVELAPEQIEYRLALADYLVKLNRFDDAVTHYKEVLRSEPENPEAKAAVEAISQ